MKRFHLGSTLALLLCGGIVIAGAIFLLLPGQASPAGNTKLLADVGPDGTLNISLKDVSGNSVTQLAPGTYDIEVTDHSYDSSFHLTGPGVDIGTGVEEVVTTTWTLTFTNGSYHFNCDALPYQMFGNFTVGTPAPPPPPPPPPSPAPPVPTRVCVVPKVTGKPLAKAKRALVTARCRTGRVSRAFSAKAKMGRVVSERPRAGTRLRNGGKVNLVVSRGPRA